MMVCFDSSEFSPGTGSFTKRFETRTERTPWSAERADMVDCRILGVELCCLRYLRVFGWNV
jgi:hypothetical protein